MTEAQALEALVFSRYLLGVRVDQTTIELYAQGSSALQDFSQGRDTRIVSLACNYPLLIGPLDGALALRDPESLLRRKLHLLSATLETRPAYATHYLARDRSALYVLCIGYFGFRSIVQAGLGMLLLALLA